MPCTIVLLAFSCGFSCRGKGGGGDGRVEITFWHSCVSSTVPALKELIAKFERENPGISINAQYVPTGDALVQKLITAVQSHTAPDISWIHADFLQDLVQANAIYRLDELMNLPDTLDPKELEDFFPALMKTAEFRGVRYCMPMEATGIGLLCNPELFRNAGLDPSRPPATWQELREYAKKLTMDRDGDGRPDQTGFFVPVFPSSGQFYAWMVWQWYPFLFQAGGTNINLTQSEVLYNAEPGVQALTLWKSIYDDLHLSRFTIDYEVAFASKQLAMTLDGPWNIPRWKSIKGLDWMIAPLPAGPAKRATIVGGEFMAIFRQTQHLEQAWRFVRWIIRPENQAFWSMRSGYLPVRRGVHAIPEYQAFLEQNQGLKAYVDQLDVAQAANPMDYDGMKITMHLAEAIEKATLGGLAPKAALDQSAEKSNALLRAAHRNR